MLSILGTDFIACWAKRKCLKVEYLGQIEYDFQNYRVTGPWDHKVSVSAKKVLKKFHACVPLSEFSTFLDQVPGKTKFTKKNLTNYLQKIFVKINGQFCLLEVKFKDGFLHGASFWLSRKDWLLLFVKFDGFYVFPRVPDFDTLTEQILRDSVKRWIFFWRS